MKKLLIVIILFNVSCKSQQISDITSFGSFLVQSVDNKFVYLSKNQATLTNHGEKEVEKAYTLKVPNMLKEVNSFISIIPNEADFLFNNSQIILIRKNHNKIKINKTSLKAEEFLSELREINATKDIESFKLKNGAFFGIYSNDIYLIMYLNVRNENLEIFNESLKSQIVN